MPDTPGGSTNAPQFGYTSQRFEKAAGIYDYNARWYDPEMGRFLQPDSIVPSPFESQSFNRYAYVMNDPVNMVDPSGNIMISFSPHLMNVLGTLWKLCGQSCGGPGKRGRQGGAEHKDNFGGDDTSSPSEVEIATGDSATGDSGGDSKSVGDLIQDQLDANEKEINKLSDQIAAAEQDLKSTEAQIERAEAAILSNPDDKSVGQKAGETLVNALKGGTPNGAAGPLAANTGTLLHAQGKKDSLKREIADMRAARVRLRAINNKVVSIQPRPR